MLLELISYVKFEFMSHCTSVYFPGNFFIIGGRDEEDRPIMIARLEKASWTWSSVKFFIIPYLSLKSLGYKNSRNHSSENLSKLVN